MLRACLESSNKLQSKVETWTWVSLVLIKHIKHNGITTTTLLISDAIYFIFDFKKVFFVSTVILSKLLFTGVPITIIQSTWKFLSNMILTLESQTLKAEFHFIGQLITRIPVQFILSNAFWYDFFFQCWSYVTPEIILTIVLYFAVIFHLEYWINFWIFTFSNEKKRKD